MLCDRAFFAFDQRDRAPLGFLGWTTTINFFITRLLMLTLSFRRCLTPLCPLEYRDALDGGPRAFAFAPPPLEAS